METLRDLLEHVVKTNPADKVLVRTRSGKEGWRGYTVREFEEATRQTAARLAQAGVGAGDRVALFAENRPEWHIIDFACHLLGAVLVPLYPNLPAPHVQYIVADCGAKVLFVSGKERTRTALDAGRQLPGVRMVGIDAALSPGLAVLQDLPLASRDPTSPPPLGQDLASIVYTSGTTGEPKGVMLSHRNFVSQITAIRPLYPITDRDEVMSFLPLAHIAERMVDYIFFYSGCQVTYLDAPERVVDLITKVRPTIMVSFPRLYERAYVKILSKVQHEGGLKSRLFAWAMRAGRRAREAVWQGRQASAFARAPYALAKKLVFAKVLNAFGGRLRFTVSGAAPLAPEIAEFFDIIGLPLLNGYGLTEAPIIAVSRLEANRLGSVGPLIPGVEARIAADGEILARGTNLMMGYWKKPEATAEAIDPQGWLHTGDIGHLDNGFLFITDRKKNLIATAGGKKVAPEPIEARLRGNPYVAQVVLIGDNLPYITTLIVPNFENLEVYLREHGLDGSLSREAITSHPVTEALIAAAVKEANQPLAAYERIRRFTVLPREFSMEDGEITPTLKVRRRVITERYREQIDQMYLKAHRTGDYGLDDDRELAAGRTQEVRP